MAGTGLRYTTYLSSRNRTGYRGVSWYDRDGAWRAQVEIDGKKIHLGYFHDVHDAGVAASDFRIQHAAELEAIQERGRKLKTRAVRKHLANLTPDEQKDRVRDNFAATFEERSERSKKGWEKRRKAAV